MATQNGNVVSFTKEYKPLEVQGQVFHTRPIDPDDWAAVLEAGTTAEEEAIKDGKRVLAITAEGLDNLILLAIAEDDHEAWKELRKQKLIDFGTLDGIRTWIWEQMTARPFQKDSPSGDGPGNDAASSKGKSRSTAGAEAS